MPLQASVHFTRDFFFRREVAAVAVRSGVAFVISSGTGRPLKRGDPGREPLSTLCLLAQAV